MAIALVGQKVGMTRLMADDGSAASVSVIKIEPNRIVQTKSVDTDGYNAVQVTTGRKMNKKGEAKKLDALVVLLRVTTLRHLKK